MNKRISLTKGQSLIEIVVAVGIIAVVLVGVSDLITRSLGLSNFQSSKNAATNIAQDQLNYFRQLKDREPNKFFAKPGDVYTYKDCYPGYDVTKFSCLIIYSNEIRDSENNIVGVDMTVSIGWKDGNNSIKTELIQTLAKPTK